MASSTPAHVADTEYLVRKAVNTGYHYCSLLSPPAYVAFTLARRGRAAPFSINRLLRATWIGGLGGGVGCGGLAYARYAHSHEDSVRARRVQVAYDTNRIRAEDHATIGTVLFAVLIPALLWKRAHIVNLVLGGAGLGGGIGLLTHYGRSLTGDPPVVAEMPTLSISS